VIRQVTKALLLLVTNHTVRRHRACLDEVSLIIATRFCCLPLVTVSCDRVDFNHPTPAGSIVELIGRVIRAGNTRLKVDVEACRATVASLPPRHLQLRCSGRRCDFPVAVLPAIGD